MAYYVSKISEMSVIKHFAANSDYFVNSWLDIVDRTGNFPAAKEPFALIEPYLGLG